MKLMIVVYLFHRVLYRAYLFLDYWYVGGFYAWWNGFVHLLDRFDSFFAWRISLRHLFQPLYKDFSFVGYLLGVPFRIGKFLLGSVIYAVFLFVFAVLFLLWMIFPLYLLVRIIFG